MNILILNTAFSGGGAEKVTRQLGKIMQDRGHNVYTIVGYNKGPVLQNGVKIIYDGLAMRILNRLITGNHSNTTQSLKYSLAIIKKYIKKYRIDVVHVNNIHGNYLGINDLEKISKICPIVWTIHDFWSFTGHCAYTYGCERWKKMCGNCPHLEVYPAVRRDVTGLLLEDKKNHLCNKGIKFVAPSKWLYQQMKKSIYRSEDISVIYNSLDLNIWKKKEKNAIRNKYGIDGSKIILAFVAASISEPRKGMKYLVDALEKIERPERFLLIVAGNGDMTEIQILKKKFTIINFGYISDEIMMNEFYALADYYVNPSVDDIFGLVNIESLASGTPIIAFDICAIREIVDMQSGIIINKISSEGLKDAIESLEKFNIAEPKLLEQFNQNEMGKQYEILYNRAIAEWEENLE